MTYKEIQALTEQEAKDMAIESMVIKEHNVYFVDFDDAYGYSALVFNDNHHIYYANEYELHYISGTPAYELKEKYISRLNNELFTEVELAEPLVSYEEYDRKVSFLHNYYPMRVDYVSAFHISRNDEEDKKFDRKIKKLHYNPIAFSYMADEEFIKHHIELYNMLEKRKKDTLGNYEFQKNAFLYEMYNHEYPINYQGDWEVINIFSEVEWLGDCASTSDYLEKSDFTELQKRAYLDARNECVNTMIA